MDQIDRQILMQLQRNAKQNTKEIAQKIGLTVTPTYERIKKLEKQKVIKNYVALLDRTKIGKSIIAYCQITLSLHQKQLIDNFKKAMNRLPEVIECQQVSGNFDFLVKVVVEDMNAFQRFANDQLSVIEGISTIHSAFVLDSVKESTVFTL